MRLLSLVVLGMVVMFTGLAQADFYTDHAVVQNTFDGDFSNSAVGPVSAGAAGDAGTSGPVSIDLAGGVLGGSAFFADGFNTGAQLIWNSAAAVDVVGADGATYVLDFKKGDTPDAANAPGWLYNHDSNLGQLGSRIQSDGASLRAVGPGFFGGPQAGLPGTFSADYHRVAFTIRDIGGGNFESALFFDGAPAGTHGPIAEVNSVTVGRIGANPNGFEFRLSNAHVDNVMIFDVGMSDAEVAAIPTVLIPEPSTALLGCGLAIGLAACWRRRRAKS